MKQATLCIPLFSLLLATGCNTTHEDETPDSRNVTELNLTQASRLAALPLACMQTAYPNK
jgi:hypothetical protein